MNENGIVKSRRRFFSSFGAMAAAPVAGVAAAMGLRDEPNEADLDTLEAVYKELRDEMRGPEWAIERLIETTPDAETVCGTPELYIVKEAA
jgi:hypothetical protein